MVTSKSPGFGEGRSARSLSSLRAAALDALAVVAPTECSGCGEPDRALCSSCTVALRADVLVVEADPASRLPVHCALRYAGVARRVLLAVKESGRTDACPALSLALGQALRAALADVAGRKNTDSNHDSAASPPGIEIATIPSTRAAYRARGYHPTELVLAHAGVRASCPLGATRQTADQAGLSSAARSSNRDRSLTATRRIDGRCFILVDDIVTTGATLREARRAIHAAGGSVVAAVAIADTALLKAGR